MLSGAEIARGVQGALGFLQRDRTAPMHFENTLEGCRRSFRVMLLAAPLYALFRYVAYAGVSYGADDLDVVVAESLRYVVDWLLFPVIFHEIAQRRGWLHRFPRYVGALNWINLPVIGIALLAALLQAVVPASLGGILDLGLQALFFYWFLMATRMVLGVGWPIALLLLVINWVPSFFLSLLVMRYVGIGGVVAG